jgi:hypothetical protein
MLPALEEIMSVDPCSGKENGRIFPDVETTVISSYGEKQLDDD